MKMNYYSTEPKKCWVGEQQKNCYETREEAEVAAAVAAHDYGAPKLGVYKCDMCGKWHLTNKG